MNISRESYSELQKLCAQMHRRERAIEQEIATLQSKIKDLKSKKHDVRLQFDEAVIRRSKADCLPLAQMMYDKLPRELRNMIYEALCPTDESIRIADPIRGPLRSGCEQYHFMNSRYMGDLVAVEVAEVYYGRNSFDVDVGVLDHALCSQLCAGLRPCDMLRQLRIRVGDEQVYLDVNVDDHDYRDARRFKLSYLRTVFAQLQHLRSIKQAQGLDIEFAVLTIDIPNYWWTLGNRYEPRFVTERYIFNILETLRDIMYELKFAGANVTLIYDRFVDDRHYLDVNNEASADGEADDDAMDRDNEFVKQDMTELLNLDEKQWRKEQVGDSVWAPGKSFLSLLLPPDEIEGDAMVQLFRQTLERRWGTRHLWKDHGFMPLSPQ